MQKPYWVIPENLVAILRSEDMHNIIIIGELQKKYGQVCGYNLNSVTEGEKPFIEFYKLN